MSVFISSQTLFSDSDSIIYISEEASFYKDSQTVISFIGWADSESSGSRPPVYHNPKRLKSSLKAVPAMACSAAEGKHSICFTTPVSNEQLSNPGGFCSQAITGDYFSRKLFRQIINSMLPKPQSIISHKKESFGIAYYPLKTIKISIQQYSRPPPVI